MIKTIQDFNHTNFYEATAIFLKKLNIKINEITTQPLDKSDIFKKQIKASEDISSIYAMGMIDDGFLQGSETKLDVTSKQRYEGVLIFAVELSNEKPTRKTLADISRAFNREYQYTPVIVIFKYGNYISLSNTQRQEYKQSQQWRGGEKAGKVTILRDIEIDNPHRGHIDILEQMQINTKKSNQVSSYEELYKHWQSVFDVSILNKSFYKELSDWYFWTLKENNVNFPNAPKGLEENANTLRHEHNAKNVIRLLTRILFVWFIKEKGLIPNELFEEEYIKDNLLKEFEPKKADGLFKNSDRASKYYKGVLQNLFFATLNQEMGKRAFRNNKQHRNITNLMRYENYFKNSNNFIELVEKIVPFMNGGLFECLDKPHPTLKGKQGGEVIVYEDGFSDRPDNELIVPDYIFFGLDDIDLSDEYATKGKTNKKTKVRGLLKILESYKFTVAENTPIEEDVALDPELLGKVFENLLASYNPETKTTARKQTGSFYTPREIVSYMVDESLIAYLKTKLEDYEDKEELDEKLHQLLAYDEVQPFEDKENVLKIINAIDTVKILDPAVGSGAFPMGTLQKMVHLLHKLDPKNEYWQDLQLEKANKETNEVFKKTNKSEIKQKVDEILEAFDENINNPDYARKLYLIENSIFGVDIQPIAIQISKLRFFISLVVEQNVNNNKANFGIRPLPNLESKFVTANTLIGIDKKADNLFGMDEEIIDLEKKLKVVRHKIFNTKVPKKKRELKEEDKKLREQISEQLIKTGLETSTAKMLSDWDPYDQNASSPFFDMEWMFGVEDGFDIVIGNPPYVSAVSMARTKQEKKLFSKLYPLATGTYDIYVLFLLKAVALLNEDGKYSWIIPNKFLIADYAIQTKKYLEDNGLSYSIDVSSFNVFENANVYPIIILGDKKKNNKKEFQEFLLENYTDLEIRNFKEPIKLSNHKTFKDFNIKIGSGATGFEAQKIKTIVSNENNENSIPFTVSGGVDRYTYTNKNIRYMKLKLDTAYVRNSDILAKSKWNFWKERKIVIAGMTKELEAVYVKESLGLGVGIYAIYDFGDFDPLFLTGILNSKYLSFYFIHKFKDKHLAGGYLAINKSTIEKLPLVYTKNQQPFINIVDKIMEQKANDEDTQDLETELDNMIYELYGLSDDEIDIVEGR